MKALIVIIAVDKTKTPADEAVHFPSQPTNRKVNLFFQENKRLSMKEIINDKRVTLHTQSTFISQLQQAI